MWGYHIQRNGEISIIFQQDFAGYVCIYFVIYMHAHRIFVHGVLNTIKIIKNDITRACVAHVDELQCTYHCLNNLVHSGFICSTGPITGNDSSIKNIVKYF